MLADGGDLGQGSLQIIAPNLDKLTLSGTPGSVGTYSVDIKACNKIMECATDSFNVIVKDSWSTATAIDINLTTTLIIIEWQHGDVLTIGKQKWLLTCKGIKAILKISLPKKLVKHTRREKRKLAGESWGKDYSFQALWKFLIENEFTSLSHLSTDQFLEEYDVYLNNKKIVTKEYFSELSNLRKAEKRLKNRSKKKLAKRTIDNDFLDFDDRISRKNAKPLFGFSKMGLRSSLQQTDKAEELPLHKNKRIFCISLEYAKWKNEDILQVNNQKWLLKEIENTRGFINKEKKPEELKKLWK